MAPCLPLNSNFFSCALCPSLWSMFWTALYFWVVLLGARCFIYIWLEERTTRPNWRRARSSRLVRTPNSRRSARPVIDKWTNGNLIKLCVDRWQVRTHMCGFLVLISPSFYIYDGKSSGCWQRATSGASAHRPRVVDVSDIFGKRVHA
jgi:hypothetical protein